MTSGGNFVLKAPGALFIAGNGAGVYGGASASVTSADTPGMYANDTGVAGANVGWFAGNKNFTPHALTFIDYHSHHPMASIGDSSTAGDMTLSGTTAKFVAQAGPCTGGHAFSNNVAVYSGTGEPKCKAANASMYLRADGTTGSRLYISAGGGAWSKVAGV